MVVQRIFPPCTDPVCSVDEDEKLRVAKSAAAKPSCEMTEKCVNACAAYGRVCPCAARVASHAACDAMMELTKDSAIFAEGKPEFVNLDSDDIVIGDKLGEGGFSNVNACVVTSGEEAGQEFAVKYLKRKAMVDLHQFKHGAADLAIEAFFLHRLSHPNIVKLHGVTAGSVETNVASGKECGFFIVVDRLYDTLEGRIEKWRAEKEEKGSASLISRFSGEAKEKRREELKERIRLAYSIADAMEYLHSLNIIFRDLKPDNIGFTKDGELKLFDFGLAKELKEEDKKESGAYDLTGNTGSRRYMAPEVAKEAPYDKSVDVYSFGILLWELCSAEKPFFGYSSNKHMHRVVLAGERPKMDSQHTSDWPDNLQWLMNHCWHSSASLRPTFSDVKQVLKDILNGKDKLPNRLASISSEEEEQDNDGQIKKDRIIRTSFAGLFRSPKNIRSKSTGGKANLGDIRPAEKSERSRTWSFSLLR